MNVIFPISICGSQRIVHLNQMKSKRITILENKEFMIESHLFKKYFKLSAEIKVHILTVSCKFVDFWQNTVFMEEKIFI